MSQPLLPAAATTETPACVERQTAWCRGSATVFPQLLSFDPGPPRLRLATLMFSALELAVTQSRPQRICEKVPLPAASSTLTP